MNDKTSQSISASWLLNALAMLVFLSALFLILTNGIPFAQWGILPGPLGKKTCIVVSNIAVVVLFIFFGAWAWKWPHEFDRLTIVRALRRVCYRPLWMTCGLVFLAYFAVMTAVGLVRHWAMESMAFDLGIFAQAIWNTVQGNFLYSSIKGGICLLGDHVSPILALLAPVYRLWPDPRSLVVLQSLAAASCIFPIAYLAKNKTQDQFITLIFVLAYCVFLPTRNALREDFHPEVLAEPFLLMAFIFLERERIALFLVSLLIAVSAKENMLGISFVFGFYILIWKRRKMLGCFLMFLSIAVFLFYTRWLVPTLSGAPYFYGGNYQRLFSGFPPEILSRGFDPKALEYFWKVFSPFLFLPFFHLPTMVLTFPVLIQNWLSANPLMRSFGYHYTAGLTPFLFVSSIYGFASLCQQRTWFARFSRQWALALLFVALLRSGASEYFFFTNSMSHGSGHKNMLRAELARIPPDASVLTHSNFIPQTVNRKEIYPFDHGASPSKSDLALKFQAEYVALDRGFWEPGTEPLEAELQHLLGSGYRIEIERDGFYLLKKAS